MWDRAAPVSLCQSQRRVLDAGVGAASIALRSRIFVLLAAQGLSNCQIARRLGTSRPTTVPLWSERRAPGDTAAPTEIQPGPGRKQRMSARKLEQILHPTLRAKPRAAPRWSGRSMVEARAASPATVQRIRDAHGLQPRRVENSEPSRDPRSAASS